MSRGQFNAAKTHCPKGHEYTEENTTYTKDSRRQCRACALANSRVQRLKVYGLSLEDFDRMWLAQEGKCAICLSEFSSQGDACVDHDHRCCDYQGSCGQCVRSLLCHRCNRGLGSFGDSPDLLRSAALYMETWRKN